ncbi:protein FAR1-RELATED SEQUENCE 5-like [Papaver somniferum]|uniref:protein FAR1-RELATED SEQUENCE 5-like n=1 Tax=Papaver somniferum TaxID=3469 RepID=UPI000E6FD0C5|nr:protein FAR1-RELATED SEQUENCE 5-like [Papaver somniferum]
MRTDYKAVMMIKKRNDRWVVSGVVEEHNHKLVSPSKRHNLRSLRKISSSQKQQIVNFRLAGVKTNQLINYLEVENGGVNNIGFLPKDARNYLSTKRQLELKYGDAQVVLDYFERQQMENPSFLYSIQVDSEGQMTIFLGDYYFDPKSRMDYYYFGDIVCFDLTYSTNRYDMPFVPIVGINHHHQTVLFDAALLYSESEDSFEWVMKTWMRAMHGKTPKVILTYQESTIGGAIASVLPGTRHRYCLWHISRNAMKNLSNVIKEFVSEFSNCLYGYETVEQFEHGWTTMLENHELQNNKWLLNLYEKREYWASVYTRDTHLEGFVVENIQNLPSQHVLKRWTRDAKSGTVVFDQDEEISADRRDAVTIRYSKLCQDAINIVVKGSTFVPVYNVAVQVLQKALEDIEKAIKDSQVNAESQSDAILNENNRMHVENVGNLTNARKLVGDPPIVKRKGKNGAMKSWIDKLNNKRKSNETKARKKLRESTRLEPNDVNTQEKQPRIKKKRKSKDSFREINSQPESLHGMF